MRRILSMLLLLLVAAGCGPRYVDYFPYHDDGTAKPRIAVVPLVDSSGCELPWNISEEFTQSIRDHLIGSGNLYLLSPEEIEVDTAKLGNADFFDRNSIWSKCFCDADYVVALELIEHGVVAYDQASSCFVNTDKSTRQSGVLVMKVRIKIIDVRCECPKIVLHEILSCNHMIPWQRNCIDYERTFWGSEGYPATPYAAAHRRMIEDIACRIEEAAGLH